MKILNERKKGVSSLWIFFHYQDGQSMANFKKFMLNGTFQKDLKMQKYFNFADKL